MIARFVERVQATWTSLSQREVFSGKDTLAQVLAAVDERVFYLVDCYPPESTTELSFGLYSQWVPKEWPTEPLLPKLASSATLPLPPQDVVDRTNVPLTPVPEEEDSILLSTTTTSSESVISTTPTPSLPNSVDDLRNELLKELGDLGDPNATKSPEGPGAALPALTKPDTPSLDSSSVPPDSPLLPASPTKTAIPEPTTALEHLALAPLFYGTFVMFCAISPDFSTLSVEVLHAFKATEKSDMDMEVGDRIAVIATPESGWWIGKQLSEERDLPGRNTFPSNYVGLLHSLD